MNLKNKSPKKKQWPRYCLYAAAGLLLLAGILYVIYCQSINSEFAHNEDYFGESFDELYGLPSIDTDIADTLAVQAKQAMQTIGTGEDFGTFALYCINPAQYPEASTAKASVDILTGEIAGSKGYLWVAYHQEVYNANGALVTASGSDDARVLSRWSIEKRDGKWTVTEIREKP